MNIIFKRYLNMFADEFIVDGVINQKQRCRIRDLFDNLVIDKDEDTERDICEKEFAKKTAGSFIDTGIEFRYLFKAIGPKFKS